MDRPVLSVVIPFHNEGAMVDALARRLLPVLAALRLPWEAVLVDDGSTDATWSRLTALRAAAGRRGRVRLVRLSRTFGQQAALTAGLDLARGAAVAILDADLQDPPELLKEFVRRWRRGDAIVVGVRASRREGIVKRSAYRLYYSLLARLSPLPIQPDAGDFCLLDRRVVDLLRRMPERNRFLRGLRSWVGFRQGLVRYARPERAAGRPAYTWGKLFQLGLDGIASFSYVPLRASAVLGAVVALAGVAFALFAVVAHFSWPVPIPSGWASQVVLTSVLGGTQLVALGVIGEYLARVYDEAKQRPTYIVRDLVE